MSTVTGTEVPVDSAAWEAGADLPPGLGPYQLAWRRLRRTKVARAFELIWAYPVYLLGIALGVVLAISGLDLGFVHISGNSLQIPAIIVGVIYIPYVGKAIRGQVLGLREREFIDAARSQGLGHFRIMFGEILPNVASTIIVFVPLIMANAILTEAGLSFFGSGVRPPNPSWGTMIG